MGLSHVEKLTDIPYSFPNDRRRIQHRSGSVSLHQQTACHPTPISALGEFTARASDRCLRAAARVWAGRAPWCSDGIHGWSQGYLCGRTRLLWCCILVLFSNSDAKATDSCGRRNSSSDGIDNVPGVGLTQSHLFRRWKNHRGKPFGRRSNRVQAPWWDYPCSRKVEASSIAVN